MPIVLTLLSLKIFDLRYEVETLHVVVGMVDLPPCMFFCDGHAQASHNIAAVQHPPIDTQCYIKTLILKPKTQKAVTLQVRCLFALPLLGSVNLQKPNPFVDWFKNCQWARNIFMKREDSGNTSNNI